MALFGPSVTNYAPLPGAGIKSKDNMYRWLEWSSDARLVIAQTVSQKLRVFEAPSDISARAPLVLHSEHRTPSPIVSLTLANQASLSPTLNEQGPQSHASVLYSCRDTPISFTSPSNPAVLNATYPLYFAATESYLAAQALLFTDSQNSHFVAGVSREGGGLAVFDTSRPYEPPVRWDPLSRRKRTRDALLMSGRWDAAMKGIVSALAVASDVDEFSVSKISSGPTSGIHVTRTAVSVPPLAVQPHQLLAAGTFGRTVGFYENHGLGQCTSILQISDEERSTNIHSNTSDGLDTPVYDTTGTRISSLSWSPCGRYLLVGEHMSDVARVYDIRNSSRRLGFLAGRKAKTNLKMDVRLVRCSGLGSSSQSQLEVWAGGTDGVVRRWSEPWTITSPDGIKMPDGEMKIGNEPITRVVPRFGGLGFSVSSAPLWDCGGSSSGSDSGIQIDSEDEDSETDNEDVRDSSSDSESDDGSDKNKVSIKGALLDQAAVLPPSSSPRSSPPAPKRRLRSPTSAGSGSGPKRQLTPERSARRSPRQSPKQAKKTSSSPPRKQSTEFELAVEAVEADDQQLQQQQQQQQQRDLYDEKRQQDEQHTEEDRKAAEDFEAYHSGIKVFWHWQTVFG